MARFWGRVTIPIDIGRTNFRCQGKHERYKDIRTVCFAAFAFEVNFENGSAHRGPLL